MSILLKGLDAYVDPDSPPPKVKTTGMNGIEIPDHEVITRRKQFRIKKENAEKKRDRKAEKKDTAKQKEENKQAKKAAKEAEKEAKKVAKAKEKEEKKAAKEMAKAAKAKGEKKTGRSSRAKASERLRKKPGCKAHHKTWQNDHAEGMIEEPSSVEVRTAEAAEGIPAEVGPVEELTEISPVKGRSMKRLRQMNAARKARCNEPKEVETIEEAQSESKSEVMAGKGRVEEEEEGAVEVDGKKPNGDVLKKKNKRKKVMETKGDESMQEEEPNDSLAKGRKRKPKSKKDTKSTGKKKSVKSKPNTKGGHKDVKGTKGAASRKNRGKGRASKDKSKKKDKVYAVDEPSKALVLEALQECQSSKCTHPSFQVPSPSGVSYSPYWTRSAVGVKVPRSWMKNQKAKGKGKVQIAYFSTECPCTYAAYVAAGIFVSWNRFSGLKREKGLISITRALRLMNL